MRAVLLVTMFCCATLLNAAPRDADGSKDHPLIKRHPKAWIKAYSEVDFNEFKFILGPIADAYSGFDYQKTKHEVVEGKVTRFIYELPPSVSNLEVGRSYEESLKQAGYRILFSCKDDECGRPSYLGSLYNFHFGSTPNGGRLISAESNDRKTKINITIPAQGGMTSQYGVTVVEIKEFKNPISLLTSKVISERLKADGRVIADGIIFDLDKADLKPESTAILQETLGALNADSALKLRVVGHTDNQGTLEYNLDLSSRRADAVTRWLTSNGVSSDRLTAHGMASLAPIATNETEDGRTSNRRVELVKQ